MANEERAITLLKACLELLGKQKESYYVRDALMETVYYDEADCDGYCLFDDILCYLIDIGVMKDGKTKAD